MSATNTRLAKRRTRDMIFFACLVALPLLHFFIFYICVNFNSILLAFKSYDSESGYQWVGLQNFKNLFSDFKTLTLYKYALKNSLLVFFVGTTVSTVLALFFSYYIYKKTTRMTKVFKVLLFMPSIIPAIAMATMFKQFAENAVPALVGTIFHKEIQGLIQNPSTTMGTIIFYNVWIGFGVNLLLYLGAMNNISDSVSEAAYVDGANNFTVMVRIMFPLARNTFLTIMLIKFIDLWNDYYMTMQFMPNIKTLAFGLYEYSQSYKPAISSTPMKLAGCCILAVPVLVLFLCFHDRIMGNISMGGIKE